MKKAVRIATFLTYTILSIGVAYYSFSFLLQNINPNNDFQMKFALAGWVTPLHFYCAGLALFLTPFQLSKKLRQKSKSTHRTLGLLYVVCVLLGGISGMLMAFNATGGWIAKSGFFSLALLWLVTTGLAFNYALKGDITRHKRWIYRSVALTAGGITLRLFLGIGLGVFHLPFLTVYVPTAWLSWLLNLVLCEVFVNRRQKFQKQVVAQL